MQSHRHAIPATPKWCAPAPTISSSRPYVCAASCTPTSASNLARDSLTPALTSFEGTTRFNFHVCDHVRAVRGSEVCMRSVEVVRASLSLVRTIENCDRCRRFGHQDKCIIFRSITFSTPQAAAVHSRTGCTCTAVLSAIYFRFACEEISPFITMLITLDILAARGILP